MYSIVVDTCTISMEFTCTYYGVFINPDVHVYVTYMCITGSHIGEPDYLTKLTTVFSCTE